MMLPNDSPPKSSRKKLSTASSSSVSLNSTVTTATTFSMALTTSTSSGGTIPGPGALSGKAILALGKITLRGAEFIIIRRRLNVLASKFPLSDTANVKGIEAMYDDLMELSRLNLYTNSIRDRALQILLAQIGHRETRYIVKCLSKWPDVEVQIFLSELMALLDPIRLALPESKNESSIKAYRDALPTWESHSLSPVVDFLCQLVQSLYTSDSRPIFRAGILDFLLYMYVTNFRDPLADTERGTIHRTSTLFSACAFLLSILCHSTHGFSLIYDHPLRALWPTRPQLAFTLPLGLFRAQKRLDAWNTASREVILWRLHATFDMMLDFMRIIDDSVMWDVCADLLEFAGSETMDMEIQIRALRSLHRVATRGNVAAQQMIREYLIMRTPKDSVRILSKIIKNLSCIIPPETPESKFFFLRWDHEDFVLNAVPHFLHLFLNLAKHDESMFSILLAADVLGLMRPFLEIELRGDPQRRIARHEGDLLTVYDPPDFALLKLIKEDGLEDLVEPLLPEGTRYALVYRRSLLCRAFNVFLGRGDSRPFPEFWNLDWDDLPSGLDGSDYATLWITS